MKVIGPDRFRAYLHATYNGGHHTAAALAAFHHGMDTALNAVFDLPDVDKVAPIPMRLACEGCGELHIDEGDFATKPHHTHACQHCGMVWRPAIGPTVGVRFLPGFRNEVAS